MNKNRYLCYKYSGQYSWEMRSYYKSNSVCVITPSLLNCNLGLEEQKFSGCWLLIRVDLFLILDSSWLGMLLPLGLSFSSQWNYYSGSTRIIMTYNEFVERWRLLRNWLFCWDFTASPFFCNGIGLRKCPCFLQKFGVSLFVVKVRVFVHVHNISIACIIWVVALIDYFMILYRP